MVFFLNNYSTISFAKISNPLSTGKYLVYMIKYDWDTIMSEFVKLTRFGCVTGSDVDVIENDVI